MVVMQFFFTADLGKSAQRSETQIKTRPLCAFALQLLFAQCPGPVREGAGMVGGGARKRKAATKLGDLSGSGTVFDSLPPPSEIQKDI